MFVSLIASLATPLPASAASRVEAKPAALSSMRSMAVRSDAVGFTVLQRRFANALSIGAR